MRADRLISLLMLLETKGPLTAKELAYELEVSQRTIYRDIESLSISGIPVYGTPGPEGGYNLLEGYKSSLNGLNKEEVIALLSLGITDHFNELDFGSKLKGAILKIQSKYKHISSKDEMNIKLYIDSKGWDESSRSSSHLNILYGAACNTQRVKITYNISDYPSSRIIKIIEPYGLVAKENAWYLVYLEQEKIRVINIANIISVIDTGEYFNYPRNFKLKDFWRNWCQELHDQRYLFHVRARVPNKLKSNIVTYVKEGMVPFTPLPIDFQKEEWCEVDLFFDSFEDARNKLLIFGRAIEVLEPISLRYSIRDYAEEILNMYEK